MKPQSPRRLGRWLWWALLLAGAAALVAWAPVPDATPPLALPTARSAASGTAARGAERRPPPALALLQPRGAGRDVAELPPGDPFAVLAGRGPAGQAPAPVPLPVGKPLPPAAPPPPAAAQVVAPALPFTYLGQQLEGGRRIVFLARGEQTLLVPEGGMVDAQFRLERVEPRRLWFTEVASQRSLGLTLAPEP